MKIEQGGNRAFIPIVITLESPGDVIKMLHMADPRATTWDEPTSEMAFNIRRFLQGDINVV